jgi:AcrR family transcriptional regulator
VPRPPHCAGDAAREAFRRDLHQAAERVFSEKGFAAAKMTDIAGEAGVAVGTLYNYFQSKEEIFHEIFAARSGEFMAALMPALRASSPIEQLSELVRRALGYLDQNAALFALFVERGAHAEYDLERVGGQTVDDEYQRFLRLLASVLRKAVAAGELRSDVSVPTMVATLSGALNGATYAWLKRRRRGQLSVVADELLTLFLSGARASS